MNFNYCQSCFKKTPQTTDITKFCAHCGEPFVKVANTTMSNQRINQKIKDMNGDEYRKRLIQRAESKQVTPVEFDLLDDETELDDGTEESIDYVPQLKGLDVEIDIPQENSASIRSVAGNKPRSVKPPDKHKKRTKQEKAAFLQEFQKGASALRK